MRALARPGVRASSSTRAPNSRGRRAARGARALGEHDASTRSARPEHEALRGRTPRRDRGRARQDAVRRAARPRARRGAADLASCPPPIGRRRRELAAARPSSGATTARVVGASDAGAHLDMIDTFAFSTPAARRRRARARADARSRRPSAQLTDVPARLYGLRERGRLEEGFACGRRRLRSGDGWRAGPDLHPPRPAGRGGAPLRRCERDRARVRERRRDRAGSGAHRRPPRHHPALRTRHGDGRGAGRARGSGGARTAMSWLALDDPRERLLGRALRRQAETSPEAPFLRADARVYSFGEVNALANACAAGLRGLGVGRGDTRGAPDGEQPRMRLCRARRQQARRGLGSDEHRLQGRLAAGGARGQPRSRARCRRRAASARRRARRAARSSSRGARRAPPRAALPDAVALGELLARPAPEPDDAALHYGDTAAVLWTSGTTGRAKGVMQSHNVWLMAALERRPHRGPARGRRPLQLPADVPVGRVGGERLPRARDGRALRHRPALLARASFWDRCRHYGATMTFTLGAMHIFLWQAPSAQDDADNPVRVAGDDPDARRRSRSRSRSASASSRSTRATARAR